jgi:hypothetical protein
MTHNLSGALSSNADDTKIAERALGTGAYGLVLIIGLHGHGADRHQFAAETRAECAAFRDFSRQHRMIAVTPDYRATPSWMGPLAEADMAQIIAALRQLGRPVLLIHHPESGYRTTYENAMAALAWTIHGA